MFRSKYIGEVTSYRIEFHGSRPVLDIRYDFNLSTSQGRTGGQFLLSDLGPDTDYHNWYFLLSSSVRLA